MGLQYCGVYFLEKSMAESKKERRGVCPIG